MRSKTSSSFAKSLTAENRALEKQNSLLKAQIGARHSSLQNSLSDLTGALLPGAVPGMSNLTSMNPSLQNNIYQPVTLMWTMLMYMYRTHGLIQTAIDMPVLDAMRGGLDLKSADLDASDLSKLEDALEEGEVLSRVGDTFTWARLFGGAALIVNTEAESTEELGDEVHGGKIEFYDAARWELSCTRRIPESGTYGFYGKTLHQSRVFTVVGKRAPWLLRAQLSDWGMSEIERMIEDFNLYLRNRNVMYELLEEAKTDVYQLAGFKAQLASPQGTRATISRIQTMNQLKNFNNALVMDKEDNYEQKTLSFGGVAEIMKENRMGIASALRMPMSKLFGIGATGLGNSGEDDIENYNALVESEVRQPMRPIIRKVLKLLVQNLFGQELDIDFDFRPLRTMSSTEEEQLKSSQTSRYLTLYDKLIINSKELGEILQKEGLTPIALRAEQGLLDDHPAPEPEGLLPGAPETEVDGAGDPDSEQMPLQGTPPVSTIEVTPELEAGRLGILT